MDADLGKYGFEVLAAYGATLALIGGIAIASVAASNAARKRLRELLDRHG